MEIKLLCHHTEAGGTAVFLQHHGERAMKNKPLAIELLYIHTARID